MRDAVPLYQVGGRWVLKAEIGQGAFGSVWRGTDTVTGDSVAIKLILPRTTLQAERIKKEVAALRLLRSEGVVQLHAAGFDSGYQYIVMELLKGSFFPGVARGWEELRPLVIRLLHTLRLLHAHGIVHRDLKPSNVMITPEGRVVLLDFGIARGTLLGGTVTGSADVLGTPAYLAPEQVDRGETVDGRADLYALGVMMYEALAGRPPFSGNTMQELLMARLGIPPLPLVLPGLPPEIALLIQRLLSRRPSERPVSADAVLAALGEESQSRPLPWLGSRAMILQFLRELKAGRSVDIWGPQGSGKSRVVHELAELLRMDGWEAIRLPPGKIFLESLRGVIPIEAGCTEADALRMLKERVVGSCAVLADDVINLDPWTRRILERLRGMIPILRVIDSVRATFLEPLSEEDLRPLFHGPDQVLHLSEDAARVLHQRTGGWIGPVTEELRAWTVAGDAGWKEEKLQIARGAIEHLDATPPALRPGAYRSPLEENLDELLAWVVLAGKEARLPVLVMATGRPEWELFPELEMLQENGAVRLVSDGSYRASRAPVALHRWTDAQRAAAHRALALALPPTSPDRIKHLLEADERKLLPDATLTYATAALHAGTPGKVLATIQVVLDTDPSDPRLLDALALAALADGSADALRRVRLQAEANGASSLHHLLSGWEAATERRYHEAQEHGLRVTPLANPDLEVWRQGLPVRIAVATDLVEAERLLSELLPPPESVLARRKLEWLGHLRQRQQRHLEAAQLHSDAARIETSPARRCSILVNAAMNWRDAQRMTEALSAFDEVIQLATQTRNAVMEAHGRVGRRSVLYRLRRLQEVDEELLAAVDTLGVPALSAPAYLNEAAVAWRNGRNVDAERLALRAAELWDAPATRAGWMLAMALACAAGHVSEKRGWEIEEVEHPVLRCQHAMLLQMGGRTLGAAWIPVEALQRGRHESVLDHNEMIAYFSGRR